MEAPADHSPEPPLRKGRAFGALRHRDFRVLWIGSAVAHVGVWFEHVARAWLIYDLTQSPFLVGLNGIFHAVPFIVMSFYAGTLVDRVDRRKLLFCAEGLGFLSIVAMTVLIATGAVQLWHIYALSVFNSLVGAFQNPARFALVPHLVPREDLMTAISLNSALRKGSQIIGPALGGVALALVGVAGTYGLFALFYVFLLGSILALRTTNPPEEHVRSSPLRSLRDGLSYVRDTPMVASMIIMEAAMSVFASANAMMVIFAREIFEVGAIGLGMLQSSAGLGSVIGSVTLAATGDLRAKGQMMIVSAVGFGASLIAFAYIPWFFAALVLMVVVGAMDMVMGTLRTTILQTMVPRSMMGRVGSLEALSTRGISGLGSFQVGSLASLIGVQSAVALGAGAAIAATLLLAARVPEVLHFTGAVAQGERVATRR